MTTPKIETQLFTVRRLHVLVPTEIHGPDFENVFAGAGGHQYVALHPGFEVPLDDVKETAATEAEEGGYNDIATFLAQLLEAHSQVADVFFFYRNRSKKDAEPQGVLVGNDRDHIPAELEDEGGIEYSPKGLRERDACQFSQRLKSTFPWLGTDEDAGSGADVIQTLCELYESPPCQNFTPGHTVPAEIVEYLRMVSQLEMGDNDTASDTLDDVIRQAKGLVETDTRTPWERNEIQFPRLLAEIDAVGFEGVEGEHVRESVLESMGLTGEQLDELFERAQEEWERIKSEIAPPPDNGPYCEEHQVYHGVEASKVLTCWIPKQLTCPKCGKDDAEIEFRVVEDTIVDRDVISYDGKGLLEVEARTNYNNEEGESGARLECVRCGIEFPIPAGVEIDYV